MQQRVVAVLVPLALLLGCQTTKVGDLDSPFFAPPKGSTVILHKNLDIAPRTGRVFLQRGQAYRYGGVNRYFPWCYFQINTVEDGTQELRANTFVVYRVVSRMEEVVQNQPIRLAGLPSKTAGDLLLAYGGGGPPTVTQTVQLWLRSEQQSDIRKMVCGGAEDNPATVVPPSIIEIKGALGAFATLTLPAQSGS